MAISFVASTGGTGSSLTQPGGLQAGDVLIAIATASASFGSIGAYNWPNGWTAIHASEGGGTFIARLEIRYHVYDGSNVYQSVSGAQAVAISAYRGVDSTPFLAESANAYSSDTTPATPAVNNEDADAWRVVVFGGVTASSGSNISGYSPAHTEREDHPGDNSCAAIADSGSAISTGNTSVSATISGAFVKYGSAAWIGLLRPAGPQGVTGDLAATAPAPVADLSASALVDGVVDLAAPAAQAHITSDVTLGATLDMTGPPAQADATGNVTVAATLDATAPAATYAGSGGMGSRLAATAPAAQLDAEGALTITGGQLDATAPSADVSSTGDVVANGDADATAPAPQVDATAGVTVAGALDSGPPAAAIEAAGTLKVTGQLDAAPAAQMDFTGDVEFEGGLSLTAPAPRLDAAGQATAEGDLALTAPPAGSHADVLLVAAAELTVVAPAAQMTGAGESDTQSNLTAVAPAPHVAISMANYGQPEINYVITAEERETVVQPDIPRETYYV